MVRDFGKLISLTVGMADGESIVKHGLPYLERKGILSEKHNMNVTDLL